MKILTGLILTMIAFTAVAQDQAHLDVRTIVQKEETVVNAAGEAETKLVTAETVTPGESVFYTITFTNVSDEVADNVVITNPIASELTYIDGSAFGPGMEILFSVDGGQTFAAASDLTITENGAERVAAVADFTHVRWIMQNDLQAGAQGVARFGAVLN